MSSLILLKQTVEVEVSSFAENTLCCLLDQQEFNMQHYHNLLLMIFHQTFQGPATFALAGAHCDTRYYEVRDYLLHHADEEKDHWQWVISDLNCTGYTGQDPRHLFPQLACQSYIAFNHYIGLKQPLARLAIAATLESIGAHYGKKYATQIMQQLNLKPNQVKFFLGHGDTDVGHTKDIFDLIEKQDFTKRDFDWMIHAAQTAGKLYRRMYDEVSL